MAVYHLACRLIAEPTKTNPPARIAKWQQACALHSCREMIWQGDTISCTRDNENGQRKGAAPKARDELIATPPKPIRQVLGQLHDLLDARDAKVEQAPTTQRDPFPMTPNEAEWVPRASLECARRLLRDEERAHDATKAKLEDAIHVLETVASVARGAVTK